MTANDTFGRDLSRWLHEEGEHRVPDHLTEVLVRTAATHQRPWWSSPERWLPMDTTLRPAHTTRVAWLFVLLAVLLALGAVVVAVGSRVPRPAPVIGPAAAGPIVYSTADGDIRAFDIATGTSMPLIAGGSVDVNPWFTNDGTRFSFLREVEPDTWTVMQASADGSNVRPLLDERFTAVDWFEWSSDGERAVIQAERNGVPVVYVVDATGASAPTDIDPGFVAGGYTWRSDADEIVFQGSNDAGGQPGIYAVRPDGTGFRTIVTGDAFDTIDPSLSPDGSRVAYTAWTQEHGELRIVDTDSGEVTVPVFDGAQNDFRARWSPDGSRLSLVRLSVGNQCQVGVASADGGQVTMLGPIGPDPDGCTEATWAPDGRSLLAYYPFDKTTWRLDPRGGPGTKLDVSGAMTWRRLAD
jgi:dipeptidyl aminopeptidase/acylaminoacyl peptidase